VVQEAMHQLSGTTQFEPMLLDEVADEDAQDHPAWPLSVSEIGNCHFHQDLQLTIFNRFLCISPCLPMITTARMKGLSAQRKGGCIFFSLYRDEMKLQLS
jgi:hypothetical protein